MFCTGREGGRTDHRMLSIVLYNHVMYKSSEESQSTVGPEATSTVATSSVCGAHSSGGAEVTTALTMTDGRGTDGRASACARRVRIVIPAQMT